MPLMRKVFDAHADSAVTEDLNGEKNHLRLSDIYSYDKYIQVFAVCAEYHEPFKYANEIITSFKKKTANEKVKLIRCAKDLAAPYGAVLALEGADAIDSRAALDFFYNKGVRLITLTWNRENSVASNCFSQRDEGLKPFGRELIKMMEEKRMIIDLSHISDKGFYEACETAAGPVIASHSNSRSVFDTKRNMTDDMFKAIAQKNGCTGVNFEPLFGAESILDIVCHIEHFCALDKSAVGIGTDFDGISRLPSGINGAKDIYKLGNELLKLNYSESDVDNILYNNFFRVFCEIL